MWPWASVFSTVREKKGRRRAVNTHFNDHKMTRWAPTTTPSHRVCLRRRRFERAAAQVGGGAREDQDDAGDFRGGPKMRLATETRRLMTRLRRKKVAALEEPAEIKGRESRWLERRLGGGALTGHTPHTLR